MCCSCMPQRFETSEAEACAALANEKSLEKVVLLMFIEMRPRILQTLSCVSGLRRLRKLLR